MFGNAGHLSISYIRCRMKKDIKVKFVDFWETHNAKDDYIYLTLSKRYNVILSDTPDYLIYSAFGWEHLNYDCIKIYYTGENITPNFSIADYAIGFDYLDFQDRYLRVPLFAINYHYSKVLNEKKINREELLNRKFCSYVYSNNVYADDSRSDLFHLLSKYKRVDSGGKQYNNVGGRVSDKLAFIKDYKFNIAFENSTFNGYTTEKILEPMTVNSLPIYWGNPMINSDFNHDAFINAYDFDSFEKLVEYIKYLDTNDDAYIEKLSHPWLREDQIHDWEARLLSFLTNIIEQPLHGAIRTPRSGRTAAMKREMIMLLLTQKTVTKYNFLFKVLIKLKNIFSHS